MQVFAIALGQTSHLVLDVSFLRPRLEFLASSSLFLFPWDTTEVFTTRTLLPKFNGLWSSCSAHPASLAHLAWGQLQLWRHA